MSDEPEHINEDLGRMAAEISGGRYIPFTWFDRLLNLWEDFWYRAGYWLGYILLVAPYCLVVGAWNALKDQRDAFLLNHILDVKDKENEYPYFPKK